MNKEQLKKTKIGHFATKIVKLVRIIIHPIEYIKKQIPLYLKKQRKKNLFASQFIFEDRSKQSENLILILAGFQEYYWDIVFNRVLDNCNDFQESIDVCVCVPQGENKCVPPHIEEYCEKNGWSLLYIYEDLLAQAQNTAIKLHPQAKWIFKIDEDIILSKNYFQKLKDGYLLAEKELFAQIGFVSPLINLNAACVLHYLQSIEKIDEMHEKFGDVKIRFPKLEGDPIHRSEDFAKWLWSVSLPFDNVANEIERVNKNKIFQANVRISIGAILFTRDYWEEINYFDVATSGAKGVEEVQMNEHSFNNMQAIAIIGDTFVGHLGFYSQKQACKQIFENNIQMFYS